MATTTTLKTVRLEISKLQKEYGQTAKAIPPLAETEQKLRGYLEMLANSHSRLIEYSAFCLNSGIVSDMLPAAVFLPEQAFGLAVRALGIDQIIEQAKARAAAEDKGTLRLSKADKAARLLDLARKMYALEIEEAGLLNGECPRPDCNAAAAVGIPADVAENFGLLTKRI
jgi:hypothetical protein